MTQREHQLTFCEVCRNKSFSPKQGIICQLTNELATFDRTCPEFDEDPVLKKMSVLSKEARQLEAKRESTFGLSALGVTNGTIAGIVYIVLGVATIVLTIFLFEIISLWSFVLITIGIVLIVKSVITKGKNTDIRKTHIDLLDDEIVQL